MRVHPPNFFVWMCVHPPQLFCLNVGLSPKSPAKVRSACSADLVLTPIGSLEPLRFSLVASHIIRLILEGAADYVERIRHTRCRQASGRWAESDRNNLKLLISGITTDWYLTLYQQVENWLLMADDFGVSSRWFRCFQQMASVFPADDSAISSRWFRCFQQMVSVFPADSFGVSNSWFPFLQQMISVFPADGFCVSMMPSSLAANSMPYNRSRWCS